MSFALTYGDSSKLPLTITSADLHFEAVPSQRLSLITLRLTVVNDAIQSDIEASLRFPLPDSDATITGFSLDGNPALAVPKAKAAEVAYKEKAKGRAVATAAAVQGAVYETTIFPLPFNTPKELTLTCFTTLKPEERGDALSMHLPFTFSTAVPSVRIGAHASEGSALCIEAAGAKVEADTVLPPAGLGATALSDGVTLRVSLAPTDAVAEVVSAVRGGNLYWSGCLSKERLGAALKAASCASNPRAAAAVLRSGSDPTAPHIGLFVDASLSSAITKASTLAILDALGAAHASRGATFARYSVWGFSRLTSQLTSRGTLAEAKAAIEGLRYDGGTDLTLIDELLEQASSDEEGPRCDAVLLLTDGVDNLKAVPSLGGLGAGRFPVHVPTPDVGANANLGVLRWLAYQLGGSSTVPLADAEGVAALVSGAAPPVMLRKLATDLHEDADTFEDMEAFHTVPDFRLASVGVLADADGAIRVSGVCRHGEGARAPPTLLRLTVCRGPLERAVIEVPIPAPAEAAAADEAAAPAADGGSGEAAEARAGLGRLLEVQHTLLSIDDLKTTIWDPSDVKALCTKAACAAGLASEFSSLLLLHLPEQFCDNELPCPPAHPAYDAWTALCAEREQSKAERERQAADKAAAKLTGLVTQLARRYQELESASVPEWGKPWSLPEHSGKGGKGCGGHRGIMGGRARGSAPQMAALACAEGGRRCCRSVPCRSAPRSSPNVDAAMGGSCSSDEEECDDECELGSAAFDMDVAYGAAGPMVQEALMAEEMEPMMMMASCQAEERCAQVEHIREAIGENIDTMMPMVASAPPPPAAGARCRPAYSPASPAYSPSSPAHSPDDQAEDLAASSAALSAAPRRSSGNPLSGIMDSIRGAFGSARPAPSAPPPPPPPPQQQQQQQQQQLQQQQQQQQHAPSQPPAADEPWLQAIEAAFKASGLDGALAAFDAQLSVAPNGTDPAAGRPSTYIRACELLHACGAEPAACANVLFDVLEAKLADFQTCRVVAYHLLSLERFDDAVQLLELVRTDLAPAEPHSHSDIAFARLLRLRCAEAGTLTLEHATSEMRLIVTALTKVVTGLEWPGRFNEIEWPALILLSWAVAWAEHAWPSLASTLWPETVLKASTFRLGGASGPQLDIFVWLGWDTDLTDVDLHVKEPTGEEVCYSHNRSRTTGAAVSRDFTQGFGPEVYTLPRAPKGNYQVETNYYASHQASNATGATSAVIWSVQHMGRFDQEVLQFSSVRLTKHKQRQTVLNIVT